VFFGLVEANVYLYEPDARTVLACVHGCTVTTKVHLPEIGQGRIGRIAAGNGDGYAPMS